MSKLTWNFDRQNGPFKAASTLSERLQVYEPALIFFKG